MYYVNLKKKLLSHSPRISQPTSAKFSVINGSTIDRLPPEKLDVCLNVKKLSEPY